MDFFAKPFSQLVTILCIGVVLCLSACDETSESVVVKTYQVTNTSSTSGTIRGSVTVTGSGKLIQSGIVFTTSSLYPRIDTCRYVASTGSLTDFSVVLSGLSPDSIYHYRAFANTGDSVYYGYSYAFKPMNISISTIHVDGGTFKMGATSEQAAYALDSEYPMHSVTLGSFDIGKYEITNAQYALFLQSRCVSYYGSCMTSEGKTETLVHSNPKGLYYNSDKVAWVVHEGYENLPVTYVTWYGANEFCLWAGGHLPTEAEWEFAARGGNSSQGHLYSGSDNPDEVAWYQANVKDQASVQNNLQVGGGKAPNELGIYDMSGNAWEWVFDWFDTYSTRSLQKNFSGLTDDEANLKGVNDKVRRGGSWADTNPKELRVSRREPTFPTLNTGSIGFRFAK